MQLGLDPEKLVFIDAALLGCNSPLQRGAKSNMT